MSMIASLQAFVCTGENQYRKPSPAAWDYFLREFNSGTEVDMAECMYVETQPVGPRTGRRANLKTSPAPTGCLLLTSASVRFDTMLV